MYIESFKERCIREFEYGIIREAIWENIDTKIEQYEIEYKERLFLPLLCDIIVMEYLPHINKVGFIWHTSKKLPKPIHKLTFEHDNKHYSVENLIYERLKQLGLSYKLYEIRQAIPKINKVKKRPNKYWNIDKTI